VASHSSLLRESGKHRAGGIDMRIVIGTSEHADGGIEHGALLRRFAMATLEKSDEDLAAVRADLVDAIGPQRSAQAARIVASFDGINRVADATGIRLDAPTERGAGDLVAELELADFLTE
jgi:hypothetical protein